jgi:hypothetical protein
MLTLYVPALFNIPGFPPFISKSHLRVWAENQFVIILGCSISFKEKTSGVFCQVFVDVVEEIGVVFSGNMLELWICRFNQSITLVTISVETEVVVVFEHPNDISLHFVSAPPSDSNRILVLIENSFSVFLTISIDMACVRLVRRLPGDPSGFWI